MTAIAYRTDSIIFVQNLCGFQCTREPYSCPNAPRDRREFPSGPGDSESVTSDRRWDRELGHYDPTQCVRPAGSQQSDDWSRLSCARPCYDHDPTESDILAMLGPRGPGPAAGAASPWH